VRKIESTQNNEVKHLVKLQKKSYRADHQEFIAQGLSVCTTLLQHYTPIAFYTTESSLQDAQNHFNSKTISLVSEQIMKKISTLTTPNGIVGIFKIPQIAWQADSNAIVLYNIQDPGNLGTLIRTAAAMNIKNVFLIQGVDPYNPKVIQSTAGTIGYLNLIPLSWQQFSDQHQSYNTCALVVENGQTPEDSNLTKSILVIGNEGQGLPQSAINSCSHKTTIPMPGKTESLNAAVAGSIAMYIKTQK